MKISIIGIGRLGGAFALALDEKNYAVENLFARNSETAQTIADEMRSAPRVLNDEDFAKIDSDAVLITTQDFEIRPVAEKLAANLKFAPVVLHTSGSLSSDILANLREKGCQVGSLHPLVSISDAQIGKTRFTNAFFCVEGDAAAVSTAEKIVGDLGGKAFSIQPDKKTLYHAAAVAACGHLVALFDIALEMMNECGIEKNQASEILLPLVKSTFENLQTQSPARALTGTFARGDRETFRRHLEILRETVSDEILLIYLLLGERSARLAAGLHPSDDKFENLLADVLMAKKNLKC